MEIKSDKDSVVVTYTDEEWDEHVQVLEAIKDYIESVIDNDDEVVEEDYDEMDEGEDWEPEDDDEED